MDLDRSAAGSWSQTYWLTDSVRFWDCCCCVGGRAEGWLTWHVLTLRTVRTHQPLVRWEAEEVEAATRLGSAGPAGSRSPVESDQTRDQPASQPPPWQYAQYPALPSLPGRIVLRNMRASEGVICYMIIVNWSVDHQNDYKGQGWYEPYFDATS